MYIVNSDKKSILPNEKKTFGELKLTERWHLQEWIAGQPSCLGEELLKESADFQVKAAVRDAEAKKAARAENDLKQIRMRYW